MLPGEPRRERVLSREEELRYLVVCGPLMADIATVLIDSALRPEELHRLEWANVSFLNGRIGCIRGLRGKTHNAARIVPMTARVRAVLEARWETMGRPETGWVFPSKTKSGHIEPSTLRLQHRKAFETLAEEAKEDKGRLIRPFVLYCLRHTALTRWAEAGMSPFLLAQLAGHSSVKISQRYVHPTEESLFAAMERASTFAQSQTKPAALPAQTIQ